MKYLTYLFILIIVTVSCEEETDWDFDLQSHDLIVVDGMITSVLKHHTITLSRPVSSLNETPEMVSGASISLNDGDTIYTYIEDPAGSGIYRTEIPVIGEYKKQYYLVIDYEGEKYTANTNMLPLTGSLEPIIYTQKPGDENMYYLSYVNNSIDPDESFMYEILLDWSDLPEYDTVDDELCRAKLYYYTLTTIDVNQFFSQTIPQEIIYFPKGTVIKEKKYSLTQKHAEFIRDLLFETQWTGGYFDAAHADITTNMSPGAVGFFAACTVDSTTIIVQ